MVFDSDSESDEESDNPEEDETELETGESKQGNSQICDHSPCYSKLFLLFYKTKQNYRVPRLVFCTHCRPMVLILLLKKLKTFSACFYWVKETWVKVWKNENCCGNNIVVGKCFHSFGKFGELAEAHADYYLAIRHIW